MNTHTHEHKHMYNYISSNSELHTLKSGCVDKTEILFQIHPGGFRVIYVRMHRLSHGLQIRFPKGIGKKHGRNACLVYEQHIAMNLK